MSDDKVVINQDCPGHNFNIYACISSLIGTVVLDKKCHL